jgi:nicotinic acid mononucleotide adenylyltransferase
MRTASAWPNSRANAIGASKSPALKKVPIEKLKECGIAPIGFLIGADAFAEIESWHRWKDVVHSVEFIVVTRPGAVYKLPEGATVYELQGLNIAVSSSDVRARLLRGDFDVPVPPVVLAYIRDRRIYQSQKSQKK